MSARPPICLVSPSHLSNNPRLAKEADALHAAGYDVHVVCGRYFPAIDGFDAAIARNAPWRLTVVDYRTRLATLPALLSHRWARRRAARQSEPSLACATRAQHRAADALAAAATRVPAQLYIGHLTAGLAAAAHAARRRGARYGFDAEDFHPGETDAAQSDPALARAIGTIERVLLPGCAHFTAASPLIGEAYTAAYGGRTPTTVLNVFPQAEAPAAPVAPATPSRLYWFSQTVGPGRGLERVLPALGRMRMPCELHLRGLAAAGFPEMLHAEAARAGFRGALHFHPLADAAEMPRLAAEAALGLSLELPTPPNRDLCLTNKIFTYLLAGVPVALTPTRAQRAIARDLGDAALLLKIDDPDTAARMLDDLLGDPARLALARQAAWRLAQTRYHWEYERSTLLASIASALAPRT